MIYKRIRLQYWIRILLICITIAGMILFTLKSQSIALSFLIGGLVLFQIIALLRVMEKPQRDMNRFFDAIRYSDFSQTFSDLSIDKSLEPMKEAFTKVIESFKKTRAEKEAHFRYLQTIVQYIGVGIIVFKQNGEVDLSNPAVRKLFGLARLKNIDDLKNVEFSLPKSLRNIKPGEKIRIQINHQESGDSITLSIHTAKFIIQGEAYTLASIHNIQSELEEKELEAWQNLIRVLTHEIMNSVTPIASLASTAKGILSNSLKDNLNKEIVHESIDDVNQAIQTIETRSQGLLKFVQSYRQLTRIPNPEFKIVPINSLFQHIEKLMFSQFKEKKVVLETSIKPSTLEITADQNLIEQVLINLLQNAIDWCSRKSGGKVKMQAFMGPKGEPLIQIIDNGPGIQKEALENIFIPFFTTKEDGSGIGLSLSRQIIRLHKGTIAVQSIPNKETVFTLRF